MPLRDVTSVVFDRGTGPFNEQAALEAYHLVAKMDDADASEFVFHVVNEVVENTIIENREVIQKHLDRTVAKALVYADLDAVAEGLSAEEREEVKKQLLSVVSKADGDSWDPINHPRGEGGRFRVNPNKRIDKVEAERLRAEGKGDIPEHADFRGDNAMDKRSKELYRGQYAQIAAQLQGALDGEKDVVLHYADGSQSQVNAASASKLAEQIRPHESKNVVEVEVRDYKPTLGGRVADLTGSLGDSAGAGGEFITNGKTRMPGDGRSQFAQQWNSAHPTNSTQQMYNRIGAGSELLGAMSMGSPKLQAASKFGSFVGQHGPAAENVFGPPSRRMAYRYRGTERKPDKALVGAYAQAVNAAKEGGERPARMEGESTGDYQARLKQPHSERVPTWQEREAGRDQIVGWLQQEGRAPSRGLSSLQLAAGHTPPSEGVLLNKNGQIVATAVGAADDWYLPFNLRHLKDLKGGEYVRSRSTGGVTTEDIYTGLMAGARRVTVVSRSGVYSVEFDPELRGGRRNNDKALRMTRRYGELLDAVQSGKVERQALDGEAMRSIRAEVDSTYGTAISAQERSSAINQMIKERKDNPSIIDGKLAELDEAQETIERDRELVPDEKAHYARERAKLQSQKEYFFRLNGLGYKAAQEALREQFPYFIAGTTTTWQLNRANPFGGNDKGYVEPGAIRPTAARANLFGGAVGPEGKKYSSQDALSARTADRAKPMVDRYGRGGDEGAAPAGKSDDPDGPVGGGGGSLPKPRANEDEARAAAERNASLRTAAAKVKANLGWATKIVGDDGKIVTDAKDLIRYHEMDDISFAQEMRKPDGPEKFDAALKKALSVSQADYEYAGKSEWEKAMGPKGGGAYDFARAAVAPEAVFSFPDLTESQKVSAGQRPLALSAKRAGEASSGELDAEARLRAQIDQMLADFSEGTPGRARLIEEGLERQGVMPVEERGKKMVQGFIGNPKSLQESMRDIQIQRAQVARGVAPSPMQIGASPENDRYKNMSDAEKQIEMKRLWDERGGA